MSRVKVLNIISDSNIGGAGKCLVTFFKFYDREKFDAVAVLPKNSKLKTELETVGARVIEADGIDDKSFSLSAIGSLGGILKAEQPDIIHAHGALSARIAGRLHSKAKIIYTRHCVYEPSSLMKSPLGRVAGWLISKLFSDYIIAVAQAAKDNLTDVGVPDKMIQVILNGIEPMPTLRDELKLVVRKRYGIPQDVKVVSLIARLDEVKGHKYYIEAAEGVLKNYENVVFVIAGTGIVEKKLKELVSEKGLDGKVIFAGFVSNVAELFNITDINVNASYGTEATSLSLLEGMSLGIPAVVTDYGGNPGVIIGGINGIIVPIKDSGRMAKAIIALLQDEQLYGRLGAGAGQVFIQKFTAQAMTKQIEEIYIRLEKERG